MAKLILGKGVYSKGKYSAKINGKNTKAYDAWHDMLRRCYCPKKQKNRPTYIGCSVADEWLDYQVFAEWFESNDYSNLGYHLDKDILLPKNKVYSPEACCFVPLELNALLNNRSNCRGDYPQGVSFHKLTGKLSSSLSISGKKVHLGLFECADTAHKAYISAKSRYMKIKALEWQDRIADNVFQALMNWEFAG